MAEYILPTAYEVRGKVMFSLCFLSVQMRGYQLSGPRSLPGEEGGWVPLSLVQSPFWGATLVHQSGSAHGYPPNPNQDQDKVSPPLLPHARPEQGTHPPLTIDRTRTEPLPPPPPPDTTCHGEDTPRTIRLLLSRRRIVLLIVFRNWWPHFKS